MVSLRSGKRLAEPASTANKKRRLDNKRMLEDWMSQRTPVELWIEVLKFLPGLEVYRFKLVSRKWKTLIENCEAILPEASGPEIEDIENSGLAFANCSIPTDLGFYYFEMMILYSSRSNSTTIGLSQASNDLNAMPGWNRVSIGYHGDDGKLYDEEDQGQKFGPKYATGDVVGCGINFVENEIFFTKNGRKLRSIKKLPTELRHKFYPVIGLHSAGEMVEVNFGSSLFMYDIKEIIEQNRLGSAWDKDPDYVP